MELVLLDVCAILRANGLVLARCPSADDSVVSFLATLPWSTFERIADEKNIKKRVAASGHFVEYNVQYRRLFQGPSGGGAVGVRSRHLYAHEMIRLILLFFTLLHSSSLFSLHSSLFTLLSTLFSLLYSSLLCSVLLCSAPPPCPPLLFPTATVRP